MPKFKVTEVIASSSIYEYYYSKEELLEAINDGNDWDANYGDGVTRKVSYVIEEIDQDTSTNCS